MKLIKNVLFKAKQVKSAVITQTSHYSPQILIYGGLGLTVGAVVVAIVNTKKMSEINHKHECIMDEITLDELNGKITKKEAGKQKFEETRHYVVDLAKHSAVPAFLEAAGIISVLKGTEIIESRMAAVGAALTASLATQGAILDRVEERFGATERSIIENDTHFDTTMQIDPKGGPSKVTSVEVMNGDTVAPDYKVVVTMDSILPGSDTYSRAASKMLLADRVLAVEKLSYRKLLTDGYLFLSWVYEALDMEPTPVSRLVGWCLPDSHHPLPEDEGRSGYIDFGLQELYKAIKNGTDESYEPVIIINPNVDGAIWDVYHKYSRNALFGSWETTSE